MRTSRAATAGSTTWGADVWTDDYARDGFAFPIRVLGEAELARYAAAAAALGAERRRDQLAENFDWARELIAHPRIVAAASAVLGAEVASWGTLLLCKPPRDDAYVAWHQDAEYATFLNGTRAVTAWVALTDSTPENGCMRVVPGSHRRKLPHVERHAPGNILSRGQELAVEVDERDAVDLVLRAGEMSLHDFNLVHGSRANRSATTRTGFIIRYAPAEVVAARRVE